VSEVIIPTANTINPGIPKKVKGLFIKTNSNKEIKTPTP
jgi:hypothetical protein